MRKILAMCLLCLFLTGCASAEPVPTETLTPTTIPTAPPTTLAPTRIPTTPPTTVPTTAPAKETFHIPGVDVADVILWFNEVCLDAEIVHSGDASVLQKWVQPIRYQIIGAPTAEDLTVLEDFAAWLNTIEGFPGISETAEWGNLQIHFVSEEDMQNVMGPGFSGMDGAVTFWYEENEIYNATICIRTDLPQTLRNSVILEELYNGLGPIQDTNLRPDSIIWSDYAEPQSLTAVDQLILKLLYHPDLICGMDAAQCEAVIRMLYE